MKKMWQIVLMGFLMLMLPVAAYAGPFAPGVDIPDARYKEFFPDTPKDVSEMMGRWPVVKKDAIPDASEVEAPAYPGAVIVKQLGRARVGRSEYMGLASVQMVSTDAFEKVRDFYVKKLTGWNKKTFSSGSTYWAKAGEVENNSKAMKEPHVRVSDFSQLFGGGERQKKLVPGARTLIEVFYMPRK